VIKDYSHCEFESERKVFAMLQASPSLKTSDMVIFPNYNLHDPSKNSYLECDAIVVCRTYLAVIELKDWVGKIRIEEPFWVRGQATTIDSPHIVNARKCKVLKSKLQHILSGTQEKRIPYVQSVVALTNDAGEIEGAHSSKHLASGDITLDGMLELHDYLKRRLHQEGPFSRELTQSEFHRIVDQLTRDYVTSSIDYADQIPGYRVKEDKGVSLFFNTYLAESNPNIDGRLFRLRVFGQQSDDSVVREKQLRSLQAIQKLPPHPGIRPARSHPNERNLIVEVTDWTETKTLEEVLFAQGRLDWRVGCRVIEEIASALSHVHQSSACLVHRNVCPKAILLSSDFHAQLTDFDLTYDPGSDYTVVGSNAEGILPPGYSSPEVLLGSVDLKSDIYSLGIVFFQALTGRLLDRSNLAVELVGFSEGSLPELGRISSLIGKMVDEVPNERPDANIVCAELNSILDGDKKSATTANELTSITSQKLISKGANADVFLVDNHGDVFIWKIFRTDIQRELVLDERNVLNAVGKKDLPVFFPRVRHFSEIERNGLRHWCLATDYVRGESLRTSIANGKNSTLEQLLGFSTAVLKSLSILHESSESNPGLIHNDINPNNLIFDEESESAGIIDFGSASEIGVVSIRGTPGYIDTHFVSKGEMNATPMGDLFGLAKSLGEWRWGATEFSQYRHAASGLDEKDVLVLAWLNRAMESSAERFKSAREMLEAIPDVFSVPTSVVEIDASEHVNTIDQTFISPLSGSEQIKTEGTSGGERAVSESFVRYLNSIHNIGAGNANALAEFQATNAFFGSIYEPIPIANSIHSKLKSGAESIIVLSGHAGDGKSTIAIDVFKRLTGIPVELALESPPLPEAEIHVGDSKVTIIKDMSEHTAEKRLSIFQKALEPGSGRWLIVSNTGPLITTLIQPELSNSGLDIEQEILQLLDQNIGDSLDDDAHLIRKFDKPIYVANLSKLDNVQSAVNVLKKLMSHPAWLGCTDCSAKLHCPIRKNIEAMRDAPQLTSRVSWIYSLLTSYERRLTMRQMTAHLAFSITGGFECISVQSNIAHLNALQAQKANCFSESFFGFSDTHSSVETKNLYCVRHLQEFVAEGRTRPAVERCFQKDEFSGFSPIPSVTKPLADAWREEGLASGGNFRQRGALRRLIFMFGQPVCNNESSQSWWRDFVEDFLDSPMLVKFEEWRDAEKFTLPANKRSQLVRNLMSVLSEHCTGFGWSSPSNDKLIVTLRRDDKETTQTVQVVIGEYEFAGFKLDFDPIERMPRLTYIPDADRVFMKLPLPLLDFVARRSKGEYGQDLDPIYVNQLDLFCSQLATHRSLAKDDIRLLAFGVMGVPSIVRLILNEDRMEIS
jgi:serine/threonine protein kinase